MGKMRKGRNNNMVWELIKLDLRKVLTGYITFVLVLSVYLLFRQRPLDSTDTIVIAAGLLQGLYLAWRIFKDPRSTQSFIFSRPFSRNRLFWNRWGLGLTLQMVTLLIVLILIASGARNFIHKSNLPYYPMVQWYELSVLWPLAIVSLTAFQIQMFLMLRARTLQTASLPKWKKVATYAILCFFALAFLGGFRLVASAISHGATAPAHLGNAALFYMLTLTVLTTLTSLHCYRHIEIEA
jgi:hypothetical protein